MGRKDFELIAGVIASMAVSAKEKRKLAEAFASRLASTNSAFNRA